MTRSEAEQLSPGREVERRVWQVLQRLDDRSRGQLTRVLAILAAASAVGATLVDLARGGSGSAASSGSLLSACWLLLGAWVWLGQARDARGGFRGALARKRLEAALRLWGDDLRALSGAPKLLRLLILRRLALGLGFSGLGAASLGGVAGLLSGNTESPRVLGLHVLGGSLLALAELLGWARRSQSRARRVDLDQCKIAAQEFPAVVDLGAPLEVDSLFLQPTLLHQVLEALGRWGGAEAWPNEAAYAEALQRHLQRCLPHSRVERELWLGRTRADGIADLVVDDTVLIEVQRGFSARRAGAAIEQVQLCTRKWRDRPIVLAIFDAGRAEVLDSDASRTLATLHESRAFVAARMPPTPVHSRPAPLSSVPPPSA